MSWWNDNLSTEHFDSGRDRPGLARLTLKRVIEIINLIKNARGRSNGIAGLDADGKVPEAQLRSYLRVDQGNPSIPMGSTDANNWDGIKFDESGNRFSFYADQQPGSTPAAAIDNEDGIYEKGTKLSSKYAAENHTHNWQSIRDKPADYPPENHRHNWDAIDDKPESYPSDPHSHSWGNITGKPARFRPSNHKHSHQLGDKTQVGSILFGAYKTPSRMLFVVPYGGAISGSDLYEAGAAGRGVYVASSSVAAGTWKCLGAATNSSIATLWIRIA